MLSQESDLKFYKLQAEDGEIGRTRDFLFDDRHWTIRYIDINTSKWLLGRRVLISPFAIGEPDLDEKHLPTELTREQIIDSPGLESETPISRQFESAYHKYYGYPNYWVGHDVWGLGAYPIAKSVPPTDEFNRDAQQQFAEESQEIQKTHLRSMNEVKSYKITATGGDVGHVSDFLIDTHSWQIRYLIVDLRRWLPGPKVLLAPQWIENISWHHKNIQVELDKDTIKQAPEFKWPLSRDDEVEVFKHYRKRPYWQAMQQSESLPA